MKYSFKLSDGKLNIKEKEETGDQEYVVENTKSCTNLFEVNVKHEEASDFEETTEQKEVICKQFVLCTNVFLHFSCVFMLQEGECGESYVLVSWTTKNTLDYTQS